MASPAQSESVTQGMEHIPRTLASSGSKPMHTEALLHEPLSQMSPASQSSAVPHGVMQ